jgi:hypothetical protein
MMDGDSVRGQVSMSVQNISGRRGAVIAWLGALVLLVLIAAFDNQWFEAWRARQDRNSWLATPVRSLSALEWRATPVSGEPSRLFAGTLSAALVAVVLTGLLTMLVCRGVGSERGRWALFLGTWMATCVAAGLALIAGIVIAGQDSVRFDLGTTYTGEFGYGLQCGFYAGWLVGFAAVLIYGSTPGMDGIVADSEYDTPSDYDYGSAVPSASYSYSPTSPYSHGTGSGYGGYGGYSSGEETTQVPPPQDPYGGRDY